MTDKYSIEEIEAAWLECFKGENVKTLDKKMRFQMLLTTLKSKWQPQEGEVVFHSYLEDDQPTGEYVAVSGVDCDPDYRFSKCRSLNRTECPWGGVAIDALEAMEVASNIPWEHYRDSCDQALIQIKAMIGKE